MQPNSEVNNLKLDDVFTDGWIFENPPSLPSDQYAIAETVVPPTQLETPKPSGSMSNAKAIIYGLSFCLTVVSVVLLMQGLSKDQTVPIETTVDIQQRQELANAANNAVQGDGKQDAEPNEVIDLGGSRALEMSIVTSGSALEAKLMQLNEDVNCAYFNHYSDKVRFAVSQGIDPLFALREDVNSLTWELKNLAGNPDQGAKADIATITADRLTALLFVVSVVTGDRTSETPFYCAIESGNAAIAAETYLQRIEALIEQKQGDVSL